jgi:hypothetical protein
LSDGETSFSAAAVLSLRLTTRGIRLGRPIDLILDPALTRVLGLEVACVDGWERYLPWPAVESIDRTIAVTRPLMILDPHQLDYYRRKGQSFKSLLERPLSRARVDDLAVDLAGRIVRADITHPPI